MHFAVIDDACKYWSRVEPTDSYKDSSLPCHIINRHQEAMYQVAGVEFCLGLISGQALYLKLIA